MSLLFQLSWSQPGLHLLILVKQNPSLK
ncbi:hypothetical protein Gotur_002170 [Gossypium turneri]